MPQDPNPDTNEGPVTLGSPLRLRCGAVLPNRIAKPAMTEGLADADDRANVRHERIYRRWSEGGAGLLITGPFAVDKVGGGMVLLGLDEDKYVPALKEFNADIHRIDGVKVAAQLFHSGRYSLSFMTGEQPISASAILSKLTDISSGLLAFAIY